jgi:sirohydrochlorin ferrochelatase
MKTALLLIAHGSRRPEANADLEFLAEQLRRDGEFQCVLSSYLELCEPGIVAGGGQCVNQGIDRVIMLPYFLSAGVHVVDDLTAARNELSSQFPEVTFILAQPLGRHPLLTEVVRERARESMKG